MQADGNKLTPETIYVNCCGKYRDMNVMASRTLIVNPDDIQKKTYIVANEALEVLIKSLVVGEPIKNAFTATKDFLASKDPKLATKTHTNFGFGVTTFHFNHYYLYRSATTSRRISWRSMRPTRRWCRRA